MTNQQRKWIGGRRLARMLAGAGLGLVLMQSSVGWADEVRIGEFWITDVIVEDISGGKVSYTNNSGTLISKGLEDLKGLRITTIPEVAAAQEALDKKDDKAAHAALQKALGQAKAKWLRHWLSYQLMLVHDRQGNALEALQTYVRLAREGADAALLAQLPLQAVLQADAQQKQEIVSRLEGPARSLRGKPQELVTKLLTELGSAAPATPTAGNTGTIAAPAAGGLLANAASASAPVKSAIAYSRNLKSDDPVTQLLQQGKFEEAREMASKILGGATKDMPMRLYQLGLAQLYIAEKTGNEEDYLSAGLSFMRVVIYYPRTSLPGAATLEAAYVHHKIGRDDIALKLLDRARIAITEEEEPELYARLESFTEQLNQ